MIQTGNTGLGTDVCNVLPLLLVLYVPIGGKKGFHNMYVRVLLYFSTNYFISLEDFQSVHMKVPMRSFIPCINWMVEWTWNSPTIKHNSYLLYLLLFEYCIVLCPWLHHTKRLCNFGLFLFLPWTQKEFHEQTNQADSFPAGVPLQRFAFFLILLSMLWLKCLEGLDTLATVWAERSSIELWQLNKLDYLQQNIICLRKWRTIKSFIDIW